MTENTLAPSSPTMAARHFAWRLRFETDPHDVYTQLHTEGEALVLVDTRSPEAFAQNHLPGAISLPPHLATAQVLADLDRSKHYVTYGADPACNSATKGAMALAGAGLVVQEMLGGIEYWIRAGYPTAGSGEPGHAMAQAAAVGR